MLTGITGYHVLSNIYAMICLPVPRDNPQALAKFVHLYARLSTC